MSLIYTDRETGYTWRQDMYAAKIVPPGSGLPSAKASFPFVEIKNPAACGIPEHPLRKIYPQIDVLHYAMVVDFAAMAEELGGKKGIAFWLNNNGSSPCASVTSEFGRSNVAPIGWHHGHEDPMRDPKAKPYWEWRSVIQDGAAYLWTNARQHGFSGLRGEHSGMDWLDGCPDSVTNMYTDGTVRQTIVVPKQYGLGTAQQTMSPDALVNTYSIMLFFPPVSKKPVWEKLVQFQSLMTYQEAQRRITQDNYSHVMRSGASRGVSKGFESLEAAPRSLGFDEPAIEITHGNELKQHVVMPLMDASLWRPDPSAVIVCWPVTPEQATLLNRPAEVPANQKGFTW